MYIIASFNYSLYLELAVSYLEQKGVNRKNIYAVPLSKRNEQKKLFDSINQSDGVSLIDLALVLGSAFMVIGTIYGFYLKIGPILLGLIGLFFGAILGFIIDIIPKRKKNIRNSADAKTAEIFIIIECEKTQVEMIEKALWDNLAQGIAKVEKGFI